MWDRHLVAIEEVFAQSIKCRYVYVMICVMFEVIVVGGLKEPQKFCVAGCVPQSHGLLQ